MDMEKNTIQPTRNPVDPFICKSLNNRAMNKIEYTVKPMV